MSERDYSQNRRQLKIGGHVFQCEGCGRRFMTKGALGAHQGEMDCGIPDD